MAANSILKLRVESEEYDAKLKKAAEGIRHLADVAHKSGGELTGLKKSELEYIRALGDMETKSKTAAGSTRELENAFKELAVIYNNLNDVEKADEGGKALAASLETLKKRAQDAKAGLNEATQALQGNEQAASGDKSGIEALTSALGINVKSLVGWGSALTAGKVALDVAKDAFFASEATVDEWGRTMQSAQSLYEGFLNAINNGDISGYLGRMDDIVKAAREAYNEMDRLGTMQTIQKPQMSQKQAEMDRYRAMLQTGRWIGAADGRKSALGYKEGDIMSKEHLKIIEQQLQSGMNELLGFHKNEVQQQTKAIDAEYKSMATDLGMSLEEFRKGTSSMAKFDEMMAGYNEYKKWDAQAKTEFAKQGGRGFVDFDKSNPFAEYRKWGTFRVDGERYNRLADFIQQRDQHMSQMYQMQGQTYRTINRAEGTTVRSIMGGGGSGTGTSPQEQAQKQVEAALLAYNQTIEKATMEMESGLKSEADMKKTLLSGQERLYDAYGKAYATYADPKYKEAQDAAAAEIVKLGGEVKTATEAQKLAEQAAREQEAAAKKLADAQQTLADANASGDLKAIYAAQKGVETAQAGVVKAGGSVEAPSGGVALPVTVNYTTSNMEAFTAKLKEDLSKAEVGSELFNKLTEQMSDSSAISTILGTAIQNGIEQMPFDASAVMQKLLNGEDISDTAIQGYVEALNEQLKAAFDETEWPNVLITFDADTKQIVNAAKQQEKEAKKTTESWNQTAQAVQQLGQAMQQIEDPTAKAAGTVLQAISSVALGFAQASVQAASMGPWGWVAFLAAGIAAMTTTINTMHSLTGFANGGIIPGSSMSGDNLIGMTPDGSAYGLNAQEVVLNRAQVGNLASQLEGNGLGGLQLETRVGAEDLIFVLNNNGNRRGFGNFIDD